MALDKADTVMRIAFATSATADQSQEGQTLTAESNGAYLDPSPETAIGGSEREVSVVFEADNTSAGTVVAHGSNDNANATFRIRISAGGDVKFYIKTSGSQTTVIETDLPAISGTLETYHIYLNTRPNPLTTKADDAMVSEMTLYNEDQDEWTIVQQTHAVATGNAAWSFAYAGRYNGSVISDDYTPGDVLHVRVGTRCKSSTECAIDFGAISPSSPTTGENQAAPSVIVGSSSEISYGGSVAGPAYALAGVQVRDCARRLMSPLVNTIYRDPQVQGKTNRIRTTLNSRDEVWLIQGNDSGSGNPGHGNGPSGYPEVCREFGTASNLLFEEETGTNPDFISDITGGNDFTISAWVRWDGTAARGVIAGLTGGASSTALHDIMVITVVSTGELELSWHYGGGSNHVTGETAGQLTSGTWHHIAFTFSANAGSYTVVAYIDGVTTDIDEGIALTATYPTGGGSSDWIFGRRNNNGTYSEEFDGAIAEYKIVDSVLTTDEIAFEASRGQGYLLAGSLGGWGTLAHWQFRQPSDGYWPARAFLDVDVGGDTYKAHLDTLVRRPLHQMTGKFEARILAGVHFTQPPGTADTVDQVDIALVATNKQPGKVTIGGPPEKRVYATETITDELERVEFDGLELPRDEDGQCWFYLASRIGDGSPSQHTGVTFNGLQIVPYSADATTSNPLPFGDP